MSYPILRKQHPVRSGKQTACDKLQQELHIILGDIEKIAKRQIQFQLDSVSAIPKVAEITAPEVHAAEIKAMCKRWLERLDKKDRKATAAVQFFYSQERLMKFLRELEKQDQTR
jgi:hypothetical protein